MEEAKFLLEQYGLWAVAAGAFFQGYLFVLIGGIMASQGLIPFGDVLLVAAGCAWVGHWFLYAVGHFLKHHPSPDAGGRWRKPIRALEQTIRLHPWSSIFLLQYGYGLRLIGALSFGYFRVNKSWFARAQFVNCWLWAIVLGGAGYLAGTGLIDTASGNRIQTTLALASLATVLFLILRYWRQAVSSRRTLTEPVPVYDEKESIS